MSEMIQKNETDLDNMDNFEAGKDSFAFFDHFSKFSGLAVAQLYLVCAAVTGFEVISRYVFNAPTQWVFEIVKNEIYYSIYCKHRFSLDH